MPRPGLVLEVDVAPPAEQDQGPIGKLMSPNGLDRRQRDAELLQCLPHAGIGLRFIPSRLYRATVRHALLQGALLALWIVFNLLLRALHSWNIFTAVVSLGIVLVIEVLSLGRK